MPEGHTIHRYARLHRRRLANSGPIAVASPQGRFAAGAARLDGRRLLDVDATGKHLFYRWEGNETLHVHLGLFGKFKTHIDTLPEPTPGTRLTMTNGAAAIYLAGPTVCELVDPVDEGSIRQRLGPDPLDKRATADDFATRLARRRVPIGAALLDQKVIAGVGNVYRAELLFLAGVRPTWAANRVGRSRVEKLWNLARAELTRGEKSGRIVTTDPGDFGATRDRDLEREERLNVYKRDGLPCRRCGTRIRKGELANRSIWWCPGCQS